MFSPLSITDFTISLSQNILQYKLRPLRQKSPSCINLQENASGRADKWSFVYKCNRILLLEKTKTHNSPLKVQETTEWMTADEYRVQPISSNSCQTKICLVGIKRKNRNCSLLPRRNNMHTREVADYKLIFKFYNNLTVLSFTITWQF